MKCFVCENETKTSFNGLCGKCSSVRDNNLYTVIALPYLESDGEGGFCPSWEGLGIDKLEKLGWNAEYIHAGLDGLFMHNVHSLELFDILDSYQSKELKKQLENAGYNLLKSDEIYVL